VTDAVAAAWASRLDAVDAHVLRDLGAPLRVVHGERDGSVPVSSARRLAEDVKRSRGAFQYREVADMHHGLWSGATGAQAAQLHSEVLGWLVGQADL